MNKSFPRFALRRFRTHLALLLAYLTLITPLAPVFAQAAKVKRAAPATTQGAEQSGKGKGSGTVGIDKHITLPAPNGVAAAPVITATKTDTYPDPNADGKADPGEVITYTVTISNTGTADATGVIFNDTIDPNTTLVPGSTTTQPITAPDSFNVIGNVRIQVPDGANDLLANDCDPDPAGGACTNAGLTITTLAGDSSAPFAGTSAQGGQVTATTGDGSFQYNPAPGFTGPDTFTYTVTDGTGKTDTATVTLQVGNGTATPGTNVVWFIDASASAGGDGRLTSPFNCYTGANVVNVSTCFSATAADDPGDAIFLFSGSHTGGNALLNTQKLVGAGASDTLANIAGLTVPTFSDALPATGGASPTITTTNANAVPLAQGNTLRGFTVGNTGTGTKISGSSFGTLTVGNSTTPDVALSGTGQALNLSTGTLSVTGGFASVATTSSAAQGISLAGVADSDGAGGSAFSFGSTSVSGSVTQGILIGTTTADINFGNTTVSGGTDGVSFQNNSSGTRTFGTLSATAAGTGVAFLHGAGGGNVTVNNLATLTSSTGNTIDIQNSAVSTTVNFAGGATLAKTASGGTGINLNTDNGNVTFGGTLTIGTSGARFPSSAVTINAGSGTYSLGAVSIFTNGFAGISATNADGTINVTSGTVDVNAASALNISGPAGITTLGVTLGTLNSTGGTNNVLLTNTGGSVTVSGGAISGASGSSFAVSGGNPTVSFSPTITQNNAARAVDIQGTTGNTITISGTVTTGASSLGVHIGDTTAANGNVTFSTLNLGTAGSRMTNQAVTIANGGSTTTYTLGTFAIFTNNANGIGATNFDGTLNCSSTSTVDSSNGTAISIDGPAGLTTLGMSLVSVNSAGGTANGISLQDTNGSFAVNGDNSNTAVGGNSTGGTISNKSGADNNNTQGIGVFLNNVTNITLRRVTINGTNQNFGIKGFSVNGFVLEYSTVGGTNGTAPSLTTPENYGEGSIYFGNATANGTTGTVTFTNDNINGGRKRNFSLVNTTAGTTTLTVKGNTFGAIQNFADGGTSFAVEARVASGVVINTTFGGTNAGEPNTLTSAVGDLVNFTGQDQTTMDVVMRNNTLSDNHAFNNSGGGGIAFATKGTMTFHVTGNTMRDANGSAVTFFKAAAAVGTPSMSGFFDSNTIGVAAVAGSGSKTANGIFVSAGGTGTMSYTITNNQIHQIGGNAHIYADNTGGSYAANFDIRGNTLDTPIAPNWAFGIGVTNGAPTSSDTINTCAVIGGSAAANKNTLTVGAGQIGVIVGSSGAAGGHTFNLPGYAGGANLTNVQNFIAANNTMNSSVVSAYADAPATAAAFTGVGTGCGTPTSVADLSDNPPPSAALSEAGAQTQLPPQSIGLPRPVYMTPLAMRFYQLKFGKPYQEPQQSQPESNVPAADTTTNDGAPAAESAVPSAAADAGAGRGEEVGRSDAAEGATGQQVASYDITASPFVTLPQAALSQPVEADASVAAVVQPGTQQAQPAPVSKTEGGSQTSKTAKPTMPVINATADTININIGTLRAGDSVTITFQVTVNNPYAGGPNVSNQGTVSGSNFSNVLTDDTAVGGAADPTLTPINSVKIKVNDAKAPEPATGTSPMLFTVTLSNPAPAGGISVNFATADDTGGTHPATGGAACDNVAVDYETASGTLNFAAGESVRTIPVNVCADTASPEFDETLLLNLSGAVGGTVIDSQAVGTITQANAPGTFIISELRTSGPGGLGDDFVELYNNTNSPLTVASSDASAGYGLYKMGTDCNAAPILIATIPNGTIIPARGHFLFVGSQYGLGSYATGDQTMTSDIETDHNVAIFTTADVTNLSTTTRLDAVGYDGNTGGAVCDLLKEGTTLPPIAASPTTQHSYFRNSTTGLPADSNNNAGDFFFADTQGTFISGVVQHLGAPGPENKTSPINRTATIKSSLLDATVSSSTSPNRVRDFTSNPGNNSTFGTLSIRRRFTNNTGANVTRLRFRVVNITSFPSPGGGVADVRLITSVDTSQSGINDSTTCNGATPCTVTVRGTTLEQPPTQPNGGAYNSTAAAGTITLGTPLAASASINVQFLLGIQTTGNFAFLVIVEALP